MAANKKALITVALEDERSRVSIATKYYFFMTSPFCERHLLITRHMRALFHKSLLSLSYELFSSC
jgi:hypothetical protein